MIYYLQFVREFLFYMPPLHSVHCICSPSNSSRVYLRGVAFTHYLFTYKRGNKYSFKLVSLILIYFTEIKVNAYIIWHNVAFSYCRLSCWHCEHAWSTQVHGITLGSSVLISEACRIQVKGFLFLQFIMFTFFGITIFFLKRTVVWCQLVWVKILEN
jgi:hypothetical protein